MSAYKAEVSAVCVAAVVIAGVLTGHDGYLLLLGVSTLSGLGGFTLAWAHYRKNKSPVKSKGNHAQFKPAGRAKGSP